MNKYIDDEHNGTNKQNNNQNYREQDRRIVEQSVEELIEKNGMLEGCENLIIGLSGGADSVSLLLLMRDYIEKHDLGIRIHGIHVHHGIRGEEADRDLEFSERLCRQLHIDFVGEHVDIPALAREKKQTEEEAGRNARYAIFQRVAHAYENSRIAVAHHMNDQAETVIMNLLRGSGLRGMGGILPVRDSIIRPLLGVTRKQIEAYLLAVGQDYVTDLTNQDTDYTRNRVRNELIPMMEERLNPQAVEKISQMAESMQEAAAYIETQINGAYERVVHRYGVSEDWEMEGLIIESEGFEKLDLVIAKGVIRKALTNMAEAQKDIYKTNVEDVLELFSGQVNKRKSLPYKLFARKCYDGVIIGHANEEGTGGDGENDQIKKQEFSIDVSDLVSRLEPGIPVRVPLEHLIYMEKEGMVYISNIVLEVTESVDFSRNNDYTKFFDYDKMKDNLIFRFRHSGDRMMVTSDGQTRKLKKELIDRKIPKESRETIILLAADSQVYWAVGVRRSEESLVDSTTKLILRVTFE